MTRTIEPSIWRDEFFTSLSMLERLLWIGILSRCADDQGRLANNAALIRSDVFPVDDVPLDEIRQAVQKFIDQGKLHSYSMNGKELLQISNWWKYQSNARWMSASILPPPEKWVDRIRCHTKGNELKVINWDHPGGFNGHHPATVNSSLNSELYSGVNSTLPRREVEDDDEVEVEDDDEVEQSSTGRTKAQEKADRLTDKISKSDLIPLLGVKGYTQQLLLDQEIHVSDLLAEYSRNLSRKETGKIREPGSITGMNLIKHEYPGIEWYKVQAWDILPEQIKQMIKLEDIAGRAYVVDLPN